jgi:S-formylglutathione hydrolase FrmB
MFYKLLELSPRLMIFASLAWSRLFASEIDTIHIPSSSMGKTLPALIILPSSYTLSDKLFPVVYLLHGWSGNFASWIWIKEELKSWADDYQMIIVCPDGDFDSWYLDSPIKKNRKFETFTAIELPHYIDTHYRTITHKYFRAISGVSMGGHGALFISMRHNEKFGAVASSSGALNLIPFPQDWGLQNILGSQTHHFNNWKENSCLQQISKINTDDLHIWIDCGQDDFFIHVNREFHQSLLANNINHHYEELEGGHDISYWKNSLPLHMKFIHAYFTSKRD